MPQEYTTVEGLPYRPPFSGPSASLIASQAGLTLAGAEEYPYALQCPNGYMLDTLTNTCIPIEVAEAAVARGDRDSTQVVPAPVQPENFTTHGGHPDVAHKTIDEANIAYSKAISDGTALPEDNPAYNSEAAAAYKGKSVTFKTKDGRTVTKKAGQLTSADIENADPAVQAKLAAATMLAAGIKNVGGGYNQGDPTTGFLGDLKDFWGSLRENVADTPGLIGAAVSLISEENSTYDATGQALKEEIKSSEGFSATAYEDPPGSGTYSIGYGSQTYDDGKKVKAGDTVSKEKAEKALDARVATDIEAIEKFGKANGYDWSPEQVAALADLTYNTGLDSLEQITENGTRTDTQIAAMIPEYNKVNGQFNQGVYNRRLENQAQFLSGLSETELAEIGPSVNPNAGKWVNPFERWLGTRKWTNEHPLNVVHGQTPGGGHLNVDRFGNQRSSIPQNFESGQYYWNDLTGAWTSKETGLPIGGNIVDINALTAPPETIYEANKETTYLRDEEEAATALEKLQEAEVKAKDKRDRISEGSQKIIDDTKAQLTTNYQGTSGQDDEGNTINPHTANKGGMIGDGMNQLITMNSGGAVYRNTGGVAPLPGAQPPIGGPQAPIPQAEPPQAVPVTPPAPELPIEPPRMSFLDKVLAAKEAIQSRQTSVPKTEAPMAPTGTMDGQGNGPVDIHPDAGQLTQHEVGPDVGIDDVDSELEPGSFVMNPEASEMYSKSIDAMANGGRVRNMVDGGIV